MRTVSSLLLVLSMFIPTLHAEETELGETEAGASLRIVVYNIRHGRGMDNEVDIPRIAEVLTRENPDLVALQEVDKLCNRSGNQDIAAELGALVGMDHRFGKFMDYDDGEYGLAVLSRLPILETREHQVPAGAEPRVALEIQVEAEGFDVPVSFVSLHHDWTSEDYRIAQVEALLAGVEAYTHPVILAGDYNTRPNGASLQLLRDAGWEVLEKEGNPHTFPADAPDREIDFVVIRNYPEVDISHYVMDEAVASDHRPLFAEITVRD